MNIKIVLIYIFSVFTLSAQITVDTVFKESFIYRIGVNASGNYNLHTADIKDIPNSIFQQNNNNLEQLMFETGSGIGYTFGLFADIEFTNSYIFRLDVGYSDLSGELSRAENAIFSIVNAAGEVNYISGTYEQVLKGTYSVINFEPAFIYRLDNNIKINIGFFASLLSSKKYDFAETITPDDIQYIDNSQAKDESFDLVNANSLQYGIKFGAGYEIPLNKNNDFFIEPYFAFNYNLNQLSSDMDWKVNAAKIGVALSYPLNKPISQIEKDRQIRHFFKIKEIDSLINLTDFTPIALSDSKKNNGELLQNIEIYKDTLIAYENTDFNKKRISDTEYYIAKSKNIADSINNNLVYFSIFDNIKKKIQVQENLINDYKSSTELFDENTKIIFNDISDSLNNIANLSQNQLKPDDNNEVNLKINALQNEIKLLLSKADKDIENSKFLAQEEEERKRQHKLFIARMDSTMNAVKNNYKNIDKSIAIAETVKLISDAESYLNKLNAYPKDKENSNRIAEVTGLITKLNSLKNDINGYKEELPVFTLKQLLSLQGTYQINDFAGYLKFSKLWFYLGGYYQNSLALFQNDTLISLNKLKDALITGFDDKFYPQSKFPLYTNVLNEQIVSLTMDDNNITNFLVNYEDDKRNLIYIGEISKTGQINDKKTYISGNKSLSANDIARMGENIFVAGQFSGKVDFDPDIPTDNNILNSSSKDNFFIVHYKFENGNINPTNIFPFDKGGKGKINKLLVTDQDLYSVGYIDGNTELGTNLHPKRNSKNSIISKYNHDFEEFSWNKIIDGDNNEIISLDKNFNSAEYNEYYILGQFKGEMNLGDETFQSEKHSMFIAKMKDSSEVWVRTFTASGAINPKDIKVIGNVLGSSDKIIITGSYEGDWTTDKFSLKSKGGEDIFIMQFNSIGEIERIYSKGNEGRDYCNKINVVKIDENTTRVFLIGFSENGIEFDKNIELHKLPDDNLKPPYSFLIELNK